MVEHLLVNNTNLGKATMERVKELKQQNKELLSINEAVTNQLSAALASNAMMREALKDCRQYVDDGHSHFTMTQKCGRCKTVRAIDTALSGVSAGWVGMKLSDLVIIVRVTGQPIFL